MAPVSRPLLRNIRGALLTLWAVVCLVPNMLPAQIPPAHAPAHRPRCVEGELLVKFRGGPRTEGARRAQTDLRHSVKRDFEHVGWQHIKLPPGVTVEQALERYRRHPDVLAVEPNHIFEAVVPEPVAPRPAPVLKAANASPGIIPNDPLYPQQWALPMISAPFAWTMNQGSINVVVAVSDTGVNYLHQDLAANMWRNPGEIPGNGIDDDANGWIDDVFGIDSDNNDGDPFDDNGYSNEQPDIYHGTKIASIIAGVGGNAQGVTGIIWSGRVLNMRHDRGDGRTMQADIVQEADYLLLMKLRGNNICAINYSFGWRADVGQPAGYYQAVYDALRALGNAGIVVVTIAHNFGENTERIPNYPGSFDLATMITVAASAQNDRLAEFSSFGPISVDLAAPGQGILGAHSGTNSYTAGDGTSYAAPFVAGAVGLLAAENPQATVAQIKAAIMDSVDIIEQFEGMLVKPGRLNVARALLTIRTNQPPVIVIPPSNSVAHPGQVVTLQVGAGGTPPMSHQWYQGNSVITGATNALLKLTNLTSTLTGVWVRVSNAFGSVDSAPVNISLDRHSPFLVAWGSKQYGQCDRPSDSTNLVAVAGGRWHTLGLRPDGTVIAWGGNSYGACEVPPGLSDVKAIGAGTLFSAALRSNGTVVVWGDNSFGQLNGASQITNVASIAVGQHFGLALRHDGTVAGWGRNQGGQLNVPAGLQDVVAVSGGFDHSLALKRDGTVVGWGQNAHGEINIPAGLNNVVSIVAGAGTSLALKRDGTLTAWGFNQFGEANIPPGLSNVVAIAGYGHFLALKQDGTVVAWGAGKTNDFQYTGLNWGQAIVPEGLTNVVAISSNGRHSLALVRPPPPPPAVAIASSTGHSVVSWPDLGGSWQLESTSTLGNLENWLPWPHPPTTNAGLISVPVAPTNSQRFFRLRSP